MRPMGVGREGSTGPAGLPTCSNCRFLGVREPSSGGVSPAFRCLKMDGHVWGRPEKTVACQLHKEKEEK